MREDGHVSDVVTGEAVALDLRLAQLPSRLTAAVLDLLAMAVAYGVIIVIILQAGLADADTALLGGIAVSLLVLVFLVYPVAMETLTRGRTLGKMALGLRVVRDDGGPIRFRQALVRGLVGLALERPGLFLGALGPALGMMVAMFSARGKRIGDMAAGTVVLQERVPPRPLWTPVMPPPLAAWAPRLDLAGFDDALALSAREFLGRAGELIPAAREALAAELVDEVRSRTTPDPPPGTPGWAYLTAVLAERRRREEDRALRAVGLPGLPPGWYPGWPAPYGGPMPGFAGPAGYAGGPGPGGYAGGPPGGHGGGPGPGEYAGGPPGGHGGAPGPAGHAAGPGPGGYAGGPGPGGGLPAAPPAAPEGGYPPGQPPPAAPEGGYPPGQPPGRPGSGGHSRGQSPYGADGQRGPLVPPHLYGGPPSDQDRT
jgi:uncharacterized RDD family membrane protein YckC